MPGGRGHGGHGMERAGRAGTGRVHWRPLKPMGNVHGGKGCVGGGSHVGSWGHELERGRGHGKRAWGGRGVWVVAAMWDPGAMTMGARRSRAWGPWRERARGESGEGGAGGGLGPFHLIGAWGHAAMGRVHGGGGWVVAAMRCGTIGAKESGRRGRGERAREGCMGGWGGESGEGGAGGHVLGPFQVI